MSFAKIRPRRGTASQWNNANPILAEGEIGIEVPSTGVGTGTVKIKFGDGSTHWNDLPYGLDNSNTGGSSSDVISDKFIAGTPCTSGNYYIANDKLYECIADTDGSINVTNSNYFEETSVTDEIKALKNTPLFPIKEVLHVASTTTTATDYTIEPLDDYKFFIVSCGILGFRPNVLYNGSVTGFYSKAELLDTSNYSVGAQLKMYDTDGAVGPRTTIIKYVNNTTIKLYYKGSYPTEVRIYGIK